jgi:hypothetical protein
VSQPACTATTKQGRPCRSFALPDRDVCLWHAPDLAGKVEAARKRGGTTAMKLKILRGRRAKLDTPRALVRFLADLAQDVLAGTVEPDVGRVVGYLINTQRQLIEASDLAERMERLEARLEATAPLHGRSKRGWG